MYIKGQTNAKRCEICHQADKYDEDKDYCTRCHKLKNNTNKIPYSLTSLNAEFIGKIIGILFTLIIVRYFAKCTIIECDFGHANYLSGTISYENLLLERFWALIVGLVIGGIIFTPIFLVSYFSSFIKQFGVKDLQKLLKKLTAIIYY